MTVVQSPKPNIYLFSEPKRVAPEIRRAIKPKVVFTANQVQKALLNSTSKTLWISPNMKLFSSRLVEISSDYETFQYILHKSNKLPTLLMLEGASRAIFEILDSIFRRIISAENNVFLQHEQLFAALVASNCSDLVIAGSLDVNLKILTLIRGDRSTTVVPLSYFTPSADGITPNFNNFEIIDYGQTLKFGGYEAAVSAILYEFDKEYRLKLRKDRLASERSIGASIRRARLQKGLNQSDFGDVEERVVRRIELGEVKKPQKKTLKKIAEVLKVDTDELETY